MKDNIPVLAAGIKYSGLNLNQDKPTKPQIVQIETFAKFPKIQIVRKGEAAPYWFKVNPL
ncbi:hypothetical protein HMPREF2572_02220 [Neisseria sp. HMSC064E01]|nr:hypothetical protein HMPREF2572_02220 [Neisseria sp. HMSC064E01]